MPELPEVETIRRGLAEHAENREVTAVEGLGGRLVRNNPGGMRDLQALAGQKITRVRRRGKYMWMGFAELPESLVIHLGMSGQVHVHAPQPGGNPPPFRKHEHARLTLENRTVISFVDTRTFGELTVSRRVVDAEGEAVPERLFRVAKDPLEVADLNYFVQRSKKTMRPVKTVLMDQAIVSGVGNIYADEALHAARIHGAVPAASLSTQQVLSVLEEARSVMRRAIEVGGTSFDEYYVDVEGNPGYFERSLAVYGRGGQPCSNCGASLLKQVVQGRSHYYCPACQVPPEPLTPRP